MNTLQQFMTTAKLSDYIDLMVRALENPKIKVNMGSFGTTFGNTCFGCAATNALCELSGKVFDQSNIGSRIFRAEFLGYDPIHLNIFESAINIIRLGRQFDRATMALRQYNPDLQVWYKNPNLKPLESDYTLQDLIPFKELSTKLKQDGL